MIINVDDSTVAEWDMVLGWWNLTFGCSTAPAEAKEAAAFVCEAAQAGVSYPVLRRFIKNFPLPTMLNMMRISDSRLPAGLYAAPSVENTVKGMLSGKHFLLTWESEILSSDFTRAELYELIDFSVAFNEQTHLYDMVTTILSKHARVDSEMLENLAGHKSPHVRKLVARVSNKKRYGMADGSRPRHSPYDRCRALAPTTFSVLAEDDYVTVVFEVAMNRNAPSRSIHRAESRLYRFLPSWKDKYCLKRWIPQEGMVFR